MVLLRPVRLVGVPAVREPTVDNASADDVPRFTGGVDEALAGLTKAVRSLADGPDAAAQQIPSITAEVLPETRPYGVGSTMPIFRWRRFRSGMGCGARDRRWRGRLDP
jgi:hypothetical protein